MNIIIQIILGFYFIKLIIFVFYLFGYWLFNTKEDKELLKEQEIFFNEIIEENLEN